jgi:hypothetical protein
MPEVERHPRQSIGGLWGVALFLSLPLRFQPQLHRNPPVSTAVTAFS